MHDHVGDGVWVTLCGWHYDTISMTPIDDSYPCRCMPHGFRDTFHDSFSMTLHRCYFPWHPCLPRYTSSMWLFPWQLSMTVHASRFPRRFPRHLFHFHEVFFSVTLQRFVCLCVLDIALIQTTTAILFVATSLFVCSVFVLTHRVYAPSASLFLLASTPQWRHVGDDMWVTLWVTVCGWRSVGDAVSNGTCLTVCDGVCDTGALRWRVTMRYVGTLQQCITLSYITACMSVHASHAHVPHRHTFAWRQHASTRTSQRRNNK